MSGVLCDKMSNASRHSSIKSGNSIEKLVSEIQVTNIDQLSVQHLNLANYISTLSAMIDRTKLVSSINKFDEEIESTCLRLII